MSSLTQKMAQASGMDDFGQLDFYFAVYQTVIPVCQHCNAPVQVAVKYRKAGFHLPHNLEPGKDRTLILKSLKRPLGVSCGCYAKFHRQVTHITNNRRR